MSESILFVIIAAGGGVVAGLFMKNGLELGKLRELLGIREKERDIVALEESINEVEKEQDQIHRTTEEKVNEVEKRRAEKKESLRNASDRELAERLSRALERAKRNTKLR